MKHTFRRYFNDEKELEEFCLWACGEDYEEMDSAMKCMKRWNQLHDEDLLLSPDSAISDDIPNMIDLWRDKK